MENRYEARMRLKTHLSRQPEDVKVFLGLWVDRWLEKWRERVRILHKKPKIPRSQRQRIKKAKMLYRNLDHREELKKMVVQKLINRGEICMTSLVAENLIVWEIARRIQRAEASKQAELNPLEVLNSLSSVVARLSEEDGALVYLKIRQVWPKTAS